jgi:hypothetical protein
MAQAPFSDPGLSLGPLLQMSSVGCGMTDGINILIYEYSTSTPTHCRLKCRQYIMRLQSILIKPSEIRICIGIILSAPFSIFKIKNDFQNSINIM